MPPRHRWSAATYDFFSGLGARRMASLRQYAAGEAHGRVLEIGCGTGLNLDFYDWTRVTSLNATEPDIHMLKRARDRVRRLPVEVRDRVRLHKVAAEELPFEDATFDTVVSTLVLCTVEDVDQALREVRRVLKPDGTLRLIEHVRGQGRLAKLQSIIQPVWGWTAAGCHLDHDTEAAIRRAGLRLEVEERFKLAPILPAFRGIGRR